LRGGFLLEAAVEEPFYADGLKFSCTRCSACCTGEPGYVFLAPEDLRGLLRRFQLDFASFNERYCRMVNLGDRLALSLRERRDHSCIFWSQDGCEVYDSRPVQCSTYPFWSPILASRRSWEDEASSCPGIDKGALHPRGEIEDALYRRRAAGQIEFPLEAAKRPELIDEDKILGR